jgi:hypothetical protein
MSKSGKDAALYGIPRPKKRKGNEISSSSSLAFASQLSSLISSSNVSRSDRAGSTSTSAGRQRPKGKDDIFSVHNKNAKKRALKDIDDADLEQKHSTSGSTLDDATWHRAKRRMEEKARLYAAMKRGDIEDLDDKYAVDFDRKWVESQEAGEGEVTSSGEDDEPDSDEEPVEYIDEFGRTRMATRAQIAREERKRKNAALADEPDRFTARPKMPENVIFGDTIQVNAFNPERDIAERMADLAANRDKSVTPPPELHFDGTKDIRTKGVGFFQFSADQEERKRQMDNLEKDRLETEKRREELAKRKEERKKELEARKKTIANKRGKAQADRFLDGLMGEMEAKNAASEYQSGPSKDEADAG